MRLFYLLILFFASIGFASDVEKPPSKAGTWVGSSSPGIQVKVDTVSHGVAVTLNKDKEQVPKSVRITFFDGNGKRTALELKAVDPWSEPGLRFSGSLSPATQSFIGFEVQIPFGSEAPTIIRSEDLKKSD